MAAGMVAWLRSKLDRVAQIAQAAAAPDGPVWTHNPGDHWLIVGQGGHPLVYDEGTPTAEQAQHIALWDPQAVLRRVAADRQILAEHKLVKTIGYDAYGAATFDACQICGRGGYTPGPCRTVLLLAEGYGWTEPQ